jgi:hypothetical protein
MLFCPNFHIASHGVKANVLTRSDTIHAPPTQPHHGIFPTSATAVPLTSFAVATLAFVDYSFNMYLSAYSVPSTILRTRIIMVKTQ